MKRTPLLFRFRGLVMVGTMHVPRDGAEARHGDVGLLLLNGGPVPRAGSGDLTAYLSDRLADEGMPCFRFDLQGLGESSGPSWRDGDVFWRRAQRGFNDDAVTALAEFLCRRFGLRGIMLGGLCAGGVLSLRVARKLGRRVLGYVLLEPNIRASPAVTRMEKLRRLVGRLGSFDELLAMLTGKNRYAKLFRPIQPGLRRIIEKRAPLRLPADVQRDVVAKWRRATCKGVPTLLVVAQDRDIDHHVHAVVKTFPPAKRDVIRTVRIPNSNHILLADDSRRKTADALCAWVDESFPPLTHAPMKQAGGVGL